MIGKRPYRRRGVDWADPAAKRRYFRLAQQRRRDRLRQQHAGRRCPDRRCRAVLEAEVDALGRHYTTCPCCERRRQGLCQDCPRRVRGLAFRCPAHQRQQKTRIQRLVRQRKVPS